MIAMPFGLGGVSLNGYFISFLLVLVTSIYVGSSTCGRVGSV